MLEVAREYKRRNLPLDLIVIDYFHWEKQGDWKFDPVYWPDPDAMIQELKEMGVELMVSVWPTVDPECENYNEMLEKIVPCFDVFLTVRPDSERAMEAYELKEKIEALTEKKVYSFENYQEAIDKAFEISSKDDVISAFGSLYFVGEIRKLLGVSDY